MPIPTVSRAVRRVLPLALPLALACSSETLGPPLPDQQSLYWDVQLNHHAVTLSTTAPYDTLRLVATPRNIHREPLMGFPAAQYVSSDPERVRVTADGMLVAIAPTGGSAQVQVVATLTTGNLKHVDSVFVRVVDDPAPPVLAALSVHPLAPDSAKYAAIRIAGVGTPTVTLPLRATDTAGALLVNPLASFRSSDPSIASINEITGEITNPLGGLPGEVKFFGEMTAFGVLKTDTVRYRIGLPISTYIDFFPRPDGLPGSIMVEKELRVGTGAVVFFKAASGDPRVAVDIVFSDPTHVAGLTGKPVAVHAPVANFLCIVFQPRGMADCANGGNMLIPVGVTPGTELPQLGFGARTFPVPGIYDFHSPLNSAVRGRIVVVDERE